MSSWFKKLMGKDSPSERQKFGKMSIHQDDLALAEKMLEERPSSEAVQKLESFVKTYLNADAVYAFGQEPLDVALSVLNDGAMLVCPAFIHRHTAEAFDRKDLKIKWVDIELNSFGPVFEELKTEIETGADALFLPHYLGIPSDSLDKIVALCEQHQVLLIEDCRQGAGGLFEGKPLGSFGDVALFSFNVMMPVNTIQGGMVVVQRADFSERIQEIQAESGSYPLAQKEMLELFIKFYKDRKLADKGLLDIKHDNKYWEKKWLFKSETTSYQLYPALAVLAKRQFEQVEQFGYYRQNHLRLWQDIAKENKWFIPAPSAVSSPGWLRVPVLIPESDREKAKALEENPEVGRWYCRPSLPAGLELDLFPNTKRASEEMFQFPTEM